MPWNPNTRLRARARSPVGFASTAAPGAKGGAEDVAEGSASRGSDGASSETARSSDVQASADGSEVTAASTSASGGSGGLNGEDTELDKINERFHAIRTNTSFRVRKTCRHACMHA
eukprot:366465-Chlamydomonas_euryale.AAC.7